MSGSQPACEPGFDADFPAFGNGWPLRGWDPRFDAVAVAVAGDAHGPLACLG